MDAVGLAKITNLPTAWCQKVIKDHGNDQHEIERHLNQYLDNGTGPFKEQAPGASNVDEDGWAASVKPRRSKKVRARAATAANARTARSGTSRALSVPPARACGLRARTRASVPCSWRGA